MKIKFLETIRNKKTSKPVCIDIGCGGNKKKGFVGVDYVKGPGVDYVVNLSKRPLPFKDNSVDHVYSSHFLEHVPTPSDVLIDISRVCKPGATIELWTPYAWSNDGFLMGHISFHSEENYLHMCVKHADFWCTLLKKRWFLHEIQYIVQAQTLEYLNNNNIDLSFAIRHHQNIVKEMGVHIQVTSDLSAPCPPLLRTFSISRVNTRYELKNAEILNETNDRKISTKVLESFAKGKALPSLPQPGN